MVANCFCHCQLGSPKGEGTYELLLASNGHLPLPLEWNFEQSPQTPLPIDYLPRSAGIFCELLQIYLLYLSTLLSARGGCPA